ncbi:HAD-IB family hydrolase [Acinetobacter sp. MD2(2019)]|uniref:HAD-IB family hydrolase n=1 Tax=Acinetobacter sp. MD2(2019) TaxID=2605273 RepID=UPI002D1EE982|nr:HAD-IB family hydrolase [Acinetobacter sp. MD2(2019)]MEB3754872.1 HAD-IB family hydrolase [Acinetobacter sp. MD2(2019)]
MYASWSKNQIMTQSLALFDFDGTLYLDDSFTQFIFYTLSKRHIVRKGIKILPWIQAYYAKLYPADAMRQKLYQQMFEHQKYNEIQNLAQQYSQLLLKKLNPVLLAQLRQHQQLGHQVVIVSASLDLYLKPLSDLLQVELICTETAHHNHRLTGEYQTPDCSLEQKRLRIEQKFQLEQFSHIYAYGNSHEDLAMLGLANHPFMVGQDKTLPKLS